MRVCQHCCVYHCHRLPCSPWKSEKSPAVAAKVKFSQADFLAVQVLHVRRKCWVCVVLWLGRKHTWFAHTCSIQLCLYVCMWLLLTNLCLYCFRPDVSPHHCRQRSGSLESQTHLLSEAPAEKPAFSLSKSQRSSSTEILDDGSSYTSQSSAEYYCVTPTSRPCYTTQTLDNRTRGRRRSKKQNISAASSGSMPNLAQKDVRNGVYHKNQEQPSSSYYISGYSPYTESDVYYNGGYVYESDTEGQYSVNPLCHPSAHYRYDRYREFRSYHEDEVDRVPHNPYATLRLPRKQVAKTEHITKNIHKALVAEHLRGWYQRASSQKEQGHCLQAGFESDRGSQRSLGLAGVQAPCSPSSRVSSFSSGNVRWVLC